MDSGHGKKRRLSDNIEIAVDVDSGHGKKRRLSDNIEIAVDVDSGHGKKRRLSDNIETAIDVDSGHGKNRRLSDNIETAVEDRLSMLPNDLIHKILSFISTKETVRTIVWASRYRFIWTTMPYLDFSTKDFPNLQKFSKFITQFLKRRNSQIDVFSLKLSFIGKVAPPLSVKKLMEYAFSHNVQRLDIECFSQKFFEFPLSLFSSGAHSPKHLSLKDGSHSYADNYAGLLFTKSTLEFPALTTLNLQRVTFCGDDHTDNYAGLLSKCPNLKSLTLKDCQTLGLTNFSIRHPGLVNLTIDEWGFRGVKVVNVVAPQLENLTIKECYNAHREHVVSAPNLASLAYTGEYPLHLNSTEGLHCLKEADIRVSQFNDTHQMVSLLQQLSNVKFLTLNLEIVELLSSSAELISHQPSPFVNLKSLTIYPEKIDLWRTTGLPKGKVNLSAEVKSYLLDSSPGATLTMFSREEILAGKNILSARKLMAELRVLLEQEKANTKTKGKAPMESDNAKMHKKRKTQPELKMQLQSGGNIALIESCWKDLSVQFEQRIAKACLIISMLQRIEGLLKNLPATNHAMIQPSFSSLCAETDDVISKITDCMKMQCDENQSLSSVCFHELATSTTMERSS